LVEKYSICGTIFSLLFLKSTLILDKAQPLLLFFWPFIFHCFSIFLKNLLKKSIYFYFVVTILFLLFWINLVWLLNIEKLKSFIFPDLSVFNSSLLDLSSIGGPMLTLKITWQYLGFILNRKLMFCQYINFYTKKALSMVKSMKMLGNSTHELLLYQKCLLYKTYVLSIMLYSFSL